MTLHEAMRLRHSVRQYTDRAIEHDKAAALQELINEINAETGFTFQLVQDEPRAFAAGMAKYGRFRGVNNYIVLVAPKGTDISVGYHGERLVLLAQTLGLNTCWVALTFRKQPDRYAVPEGQHVACVISIGYGENQGHAHTKQRPIEDCCRVDGEMPRWFRMGMEAAMLAPTAINQQKFVFTLLPKHTGKPVVDASTRFSLLGYTRLDLGIAMCHFEIGAGKDTFAWNKDIQQM